MIFKEQKLILNIFLFSIMPRINAILSLFIFPLITPFLTEKDFGIWGIISAYYAIGFAISTLGLDVNFVNSFFIYKTRFKPAWRLISGIVHISGLLFSMLFAVILYIILPEIENKIILVVLASLPIFFQNVSKISGHLLTLREMAFPITVRTAIAAVFSVGITYILIAIFKLGFWGWVVAYFVNAMIIFLSYFHFLYIKEKIVPILNIRFSKLKRFLKVSTPIIPHALALVVLGSSDRIVMERLHIHIDDIGLYSLGYRMANYMFTFVAGIIAALTPRLQLFYRSRKFEKFSQTIWICYIVILFVTVMGSLWMREVFIILVRNEALHVAAPLGSIAVFAASFHIWYFAVSLPLLIKEKTKLLPWIIIVPALVNVLLNFLAIPIWGYKSALYTTFLCYLLVPFMGLFIPKIRTYIFELMPGFKRNIILVAIINTLVLISCLYCKEFAFYNKIAISSVLFIACGLFISKKYLNLKNLDK